MPSTVIKRYKYDARAHELRITFQSGKVYVYEDVPADTFDALNAAFSKGEFFGMHIRNTYAFRKDAA